MSRFVEIADLTIVNADKVKSLRIEQQVPKWDLLVEFDRGYNIVSMHDSEKAAREAYERAKRALTGDK